jgi:CNT family concentrative nucleoside transporter
VIQGAAGIAGLLLLAWVFSENRKALPWRAIGAGLLLQFVLRAADDQAAVCQGIVHFLE